MASWLMSPVFRPPFPNKWNALPSNFKEGLEAAVNHFLYPDLYPDRFRRAPSDCTDEINHIRESDAFRSLDENTQGAIDTIFNNILQSRDNLSAAALIATYNQNLQDYGLDVDVLRIDDLCLTPPNTTLATTTNGTDTTTTISTTTNSSTTTFSDDNNSYHNTPYNACSDDET